RRRHTRFSRDWSSDVCSSDLKKDFEFLVVHLFLLPLVHQASSTLPLAPPCKRRNDHDDLEEGHTSENGHDRRPVPQGFVPLVEEIGRASCREREKSETTHISS